MVVVLTRSRASDFKRFSAAEGSRPRMSALTTSVSSTYISCLEVDRPRPSFASRSDNVAHDAVEVLDVSRDAVKLMPPSAIVETSNVRRYEDGDRAPATLDDDAPPSLHLAQGLGEMSFEVGDS